MTGTVVITKVRDVPLVCQGAPMTGVVVITKVRDVPLVAGERP